MLTTRKSTGSISRSERVKKTWQNPDRRKKQSEALKKCWRREDYRIRLTEHLRKVAPKGLREIARMRASGELVISDEARKRLSAAQKRRFQRPEELKKLERARSLQVVDFGERAKVMQNAFLKKYGSFLELAKMGMKAPKRKPSRLELQVAKRLGPDWKYVGDGRITVGGLVPDFVHWTRKELLEVLGCYYHACPIHHPDAPIRPQALPSFRESRYRADGYSVKFLWEHDIKAGKFEFTGPGVEKQSILSKA